MANPTVATQAAGWRSELRDGYLTMLPLWLGAAPFGVIYAVSALAAGLTPAQILAIWQQSAAYVSALYAASWALKAMQPIPADFAADHHWQGE